MERGQISRSIYFECWNQVDKDEELPSVTSQDDAVGLVLLLLRNYAGEDVKSKIRANKGCKEKRRWTQKLPGKTEQYAY